ncbi:hypothetical protein SBADM41S_10391 [Streptomyces badius]
MNASSWPGTTTTAAEAFHHARVVRGALAVDRDLGVGPLQRVPVEALRRLHRAQPGPYGGGEHRLRLPGRGGGLDLLDGVRERQRGDDGGRPVPYRGGDGVDRVDRHQRAGGVVDQDDGDILGQRFETEADGLLTGLTARHHQVVGALGQCVLVEEVLHLGRAARRGDDHDEGDGAGRGHGANGVNQHGRPAEHPEGLGRARA